MKKFLVLIFCALSSPIVAQNARLDSLERVIASGSLRNLEIGELLVSISSDYLSIDHSISKTYAYRALEFAKENGLRKIEIRWGILVC